MPLTIGTNTGISSPMNKLIVVIFLISISCSSAIAGYGVLYEDCSFHVPGMPPIADGHYSSSCTCCCGMCAFCSSDVTRGIEVGYYSSSGGYCGWMSGCSGTIETYSSGIIEFNITSVDSLFNGDQIEAELSLQVKRGNLPWYKCLSLYNIQDANENGVIEGVDVTNVNDYIDTICENLLPGDMITFDVTSAVEHDLFTSDQTVFSGFVITANAPGWGERSIRLYDRTHPFLGPKLRVSGMCPVSVIYGTSSEQSKVLRYCRDNVLSRTSEGRELVELYYQWSPAIVRAMEDDEEFKEGVKESIDAILLMLEKVMK